MADIAVITGQKMTREEMIERIVELSDEIKVSKKNMQKSRDEMLIKMHNYEDMLKEREVLEVEEEIDNALLTA